MCRTGQYKKEISVLQDCRSRSFFRQCYLQGARKRQTPELLTGTFSRQNVYSTTFTLFTLAPRALVLADAPTSTLFTLAPHALVLADAPTPTLRTLAPLALVLAEAPTPTLLTLAPLALVLAEAPTLHSNHMIMSHCSQALPGQTTRDHFLPSSCLPATHYPQHVRSLSEPSLPPGSTTCQSPKDCKRPRRHPRGRAAWSHRPRMLDGDGRPRV